MNISSHISTTVEYIDQQLAELSATIDTLNEARIALVGQSSNVSAKRHAAKPTTKLVVTDRESPEKTTPAKKPVAKKTTAKKPAKSKSTRRDQIVAMLEAGKTPKQVADKLGIAPNYVYHVKRSAHLKVAA